MPRERNGQSGEAKIGCVIWVILAIGTLWWAFQYIPVRIASAELDEFISQQGRFAAQHGPRFMTKQIMNKAVELDLPLKERDIVIRKLPHDEISIQATYTVPLKFPFYTHQLVVKHDIKEANFSGY